MLFSWIAHVTVNFNTAATFLNSQVCQLMSHAKYVMWLCGTGSVPESEGAVGVRGQCRRGHDDHFPDFPDRSVWEPTHVRFKGKWGQDSSHK